MDMLNAGRVLSSSAFSCMGILETWKEVFPGLMRKGNLFPQV